MCVKHLYIYHICVVYKNLIPVFIGVTVVISVLDINEMFGKKIDDTDKVIVESMYVRICMLSTCTYVVHQATVRKLATCFCWCHSNNICARY